MSYRRNIKIINWTILLFLLISLSSYLIYYKILIYLEKTSYIWYLISQRELHESEYEIAIFGDSQLMSGLKPDDFSKILLNYGRKYKVLYFPRPSEQPEGIFTNILRLDRKGIKIKKIYANISPVTTSKNNISEAHKRLVINFSPFTSEFYRYNSLHKYYLRYTSENINYLFIQLFPLLKLNGNFSSHLKLIPSSENFISIKNEVESFFQNPLDELLKNKKQNEFLKEELERNGYYWEWNQFESYNGKCKKKKDLVQLPAGIEIAFQKERKEAKAQWLELSEYLRKHNIQFEYIYIPFSPTTENKINSKNEDSPLNITLGEIKNKYGDSVIWKIDPKQFSQEDYIDYTHFNVCGMKKFTTLFARKVLNLK